MRLRWIDDAENQTEYLSSHTLGSVRAQKRLEIPAIVESRAEWIGDQFTNRRIDANFRVGDQFL